ncbi:fluoride efflux transporter FluC [Gardnerella greenwoodii]|uniref:Fluoride-specific ion channel n=1 Tax=Gardnerella greenwoodii 00703Dmash TaxID=698960 RepID=I4MB72_9BIFI|nr:CrcB family protein [Gardnerella greenwoodii]EIK86462.1 CrcB protein [Gardnerella greenwoodii 00703Dmash]
MNPLYVFTIFVLPCFFGGLGAVLRCAMTKKISASHNSRIPVATLFINCLASFTLGVVANVFMVAVSIFGANFVYLMILGFLGGFSTFSTAIFEGVDLIQKKAHKRWHFSTLCGAYCAIFVCFYWLCCFANFVISNILVFKS